MLEATEKTVLGDFDRATASVAGVTSTFFRRDGAYVIRTEGPTGELQDYPIRYTFGWSPLQQYLIAFPGGRLQSLGLAWDSRAKQDGGQRWFHLYPDDTIGPKNALHWTGREQNWNYQCAECHSTNLRKGYDLASDSFKTTWSEINVACEACHGPGSRHVEQATQAADGDSSAWGDHKGLVVDLSDRDGGIWTLDSKSGLPRRSVPRSSHADINTCARCHSRRGLLSEDSTPGEPLGETHRLALLEPDLYFPDGQIQGEVYVFGSFLQSRMFHQGVTCSDCHDPHSLTLKAPGNAVCTQCHPASRYDSDSHHHHPPGSDGAACIACHMPKRRYMVVDDRADHSLRIPRPDLTRKIGSPNACNGCHVEQTTEWAEQAVAAWYGADVAQRPHYGEAIAAGRAGAPNADPALLELAANPDAPGIARATAIELISNGADPAHVTAIQALLKDPDDLVRAAAVRALQFADLATLTEQVFPLLDDSVLTVRVDAARSLAPLAAPRLSSRLSEEQRRRLEQGLDAYRQAQLATAERPESHLNIGLLETAAHRPEAAEQAYRTAIRLDPGFAPGYVNLADLYRALGRDTDGELVLNQGLEQLPEDAALHHALGLMRIRQGRLPEAVTALAQAAQLAPENPHYPYVYALALQRAGAPAKAIRALRKAHNQHPSDADILIALVSIAQQSGDQETLQVFAERLQALQRSQ